MKKLFLLAGLLLVTSEFILTMKKEEVWEVEKNHETYVVRYDKELNLNHLGLEEQTNCCGIKGYSSFIAQKEQFFKLYEEGGNPCAQQKLIFNSAKTLAYLLFEKTSYWRDFHYNQTNTEKITHLAITKKDELNQWSSFMLAEIERYSLLSPIYVAPIIDLENLREDTTFVMQASDKMCYHMRVIEQDCPIRKFALFVLDQKRCDSISDYYKRLEKELINHYELESNLAFKILELLNKEYQSDEFPDEFKKDELIRIYKERVEGLSFGMNQIKLKNPVFNVGCTATCFSFCSKDLKMKHAISYISHRQSKDYNGYEWANFIKLPYDGSKCTFPPRVFALAFIIKSSTSAEPLHGQIEMGDCDEKTHITFIPEKNVIDYALARRDYEKNLREYEEKKRELAIEELRAAVAKKIAEEKQQSKK